MGIEKWLVALMVVALLFLVPAAACVYVWAGRAGHTPPVRPDQIHRR